MEQSIDGPIDSLHFHFSLHLQGCKKVASMVSENQGPQERASQYRARSTDFNRSPMLVFYEVTRACGLVCQHCRACAQTHSHPDELTTQESFRLIDQLAEFPQPPMLILTGGDPLCRADVFRLIEYATHAGIEVSITPSATPLVTKEAIKKFHDAGIHRMAISIDAADAESHDRVRGVAGSFARSLEILRDAREIGLATQINTTLTPDNVDQIDAMAELFAEFEIVLWSVFFLVPVGRAESGPRLSPDGCEAAFQKLWNHSQSQSYMIKTTEAPHFRRFSMQQAQRVSAVKGKRPAFMATSLNDGKGVMFVGHTGEVFPSGFMPIHCGQFPQDNIVQVYQESQLFQDLRVPNRLEGKCGQCEFRTICGGSRARSYALTGNPLAEEPDCAYIPQAIRV